MLGFGLLIPVLPELVKQFQGGSVVEGSHSYGWLVSSYALMQFIGSPILGSLSDRFGRRKVILIALAGSSIDFVVMAMAPSLTILFLARMVGGITAGVLSTANAYMADVTPPAQRAQAFGMIGAAFGLSFIIGPLIGGILGSVDIRLPFWVAAGCSASTGLRFLRAARVARPENRRGFSWKREPGWRPGRAQAFSRGARARRIVFHPDPRADDAVFNLGALHEPPLSLGPEARRVFADLVGVMSAIVQAVIARRIIGRIGDVRGVTLGLLLSATSQMLYGLAPHGWIVYLIIPLGSLAGIAGPAMQSYITQHVPPNEQGAVQGIYSGLASFAGIPGPLIAAWSFGWAVGPGQPAWLSGITFFIGAALALSPAPSRCDRLPGPRAADAPVHS